MRNNIITLISFYLLLYGITSSAEGQVKVQPKVIVTTDGEVDDYDSFIRFLYMANEFDIEGLIYNSSQFHYQGDGKGTPFYSEMKRTQRYGERLTLRWTGTQWIGNLIDEYAKIYNNLVKNDVNYPSPEYLRSITKVGNIDFEGEMSYDTEGSNYIKEKLLNDDTTNLFLLAWGGTNTIARALKSIEEEYRDDLDFDRIKDKVNKKAIIYIILDQDATYEKYIKPFWPEIKIYLNRRQFGGIAYAWKRLIPKDNLKYIDGDWFEGNILTKGTLAEKYFTWGDGRRLVGDEDFQSDLEKGGFSRGFVKYDFISEGDSPSFLHLVDVGLGNIYQPSFGGWGGRLAHDSNSPVVWTDNKKAYDFNKEVDSFDLYYPQTRWVKALQNEFAARVIWGGNGFENSNHPPIIKMKEGNNILVKPGERIQLNAEVYDPDGDAVTISWWNYKEVGTFLGDIKIEENGSRARVYIPKEAKSGETIHVIAEAEDKGVPSLTRYQRIILEIR